MQKIVQIVKKTTPWVQKQIFEYEPEMRTHKPRPIVLVYDATFYGKRKDKLGTLFFKVKITLQSFKVLV